MHLIHTNQRPAYMAEKPALKTKFGEWASSHGGPATWNNLPESEALV